MDTELGKNQQKCSVGINWLYGNLQQTVVYLIIFLNCVLHPLYISKIYNKPIYAHFSRKPVAKHLSALQCSKLSYHLASQGERETSHAFLHQVNEYQSPPNIVYLF